MGWVHNATPEVEAASQYPLILGVCLTLTIVMVITVCLRLFLRARASRLAAADYVMVVSMVSILACHTRGIQLTFEKIFSVIYSALCISRGHLHLHLHKKDSHYRRK
jgi:hypothetical protein